MSDTTETFEIPPAVAEFYEARFVPALFAPWAKRLVAAAGIREGARVLDVACGTGAVARAAAERAGETGSVTGLDLNDAMLSVARRLRPDLEWHHGDAAELPFSDDAYDVVTCQAALMFVPDPQRAIGEMARVVTPEGTVGVQVWAGRSDQPAYDPFNEVVERHAGPDAANLVNAYFVLGDRPRLEAMVRSTGLEIAEALTESRSMRFANVEELVAIEIQGTPLGERLSEDVIGKIVEDARVALEGFANEDGAVDIPLGGHIVIAHPA